MSASVESESRTLPASVNYRLLRIASEQFGKPVTDLSAKEHNQVKSIAAHEFLLERTVLSSPEASGVFVPASQVEAAISQIKARYSDADAFANELHDNNMNLEDLSSALEREIRVQAVLDKVGSESPEPDEMEVRLYYYMNIEKFKRPETRLARHILITVNPTFPENQRDVVVDRLTAIRKRLEKNPSRFEEQAMKHSECPSSLQGGVLGDLEFGKLYPELDAVLFQLPVGKVSEIVESPVGLHLVFCESITPAGTLSLKEVLPKLKEQLHQRQRRKHSRQWIQNLLRSNSEVTSDSME